MKVGAIRIRPIESLEDVEITRATLLSIEEYEEYKCYILYTNDCWWHPLPGDICYFDNWWLRSPGKYSDRAAVVDDDGSGRDYSSHVVHFDYAIRPALQISNLGDVKVGNKIKFGGKTFTVISPEYALCDTAIGHGAFRKDRNAADANVYEASDVKKFVDKWFEDAVKAAENDA